jgi:hypothetical protein
MSSGIDMSVRIAIIKPALGGLSSDPEHADANQTGATPIAATMIAGFTELRQNTDDPMFLFYTTPAAARTSRSLRP